MLSILIPVYEKNVTKLVNKLIKQCHAAKIEFEIICFDDGSSEKIKTQNKAIDLLIGVNYVELSENKGRAKIRNMLAKTARYDHLLFLDCDTVLKGSKLIKNYLPYLKGRGVCSGGREYQNKPPKDTSKKLHWTYGHKRESKSEGFRNKNHVSYFHSNNFVIDRHTMMENPFDESIQGYGYEDLAMAHQLDQRKVSILHIDNPIRHDGLESFEVFMKKAQNSVINLFDLYKQGRVPHTRLIKAYKYLDTYYFKDRYIRWMSSRQGKMIQNLSENPSKLYRLDLLKLYWMCKESLKWE